MIAVSSYRGKALYGLTHVIKAGLVAVTTEVAGKVTVIWALGVVRTFVVVAVAVAVLVTVGVGARTVVVLGALRVVVVALNALVTTTQVTAAGYDGGGFLLATGQKGLGERARSGPAPTERFFWAELGRVSSTGLKPEGAAIVVVP